ncbi:MAG: hypothetical protein HYX24_02530 [Candidatus Aenigmarchaeota archaeon]|nr:hypothetical protein [Candidatus Aenigmarchaeota archaeon]
MQLSIRDVDEKTFREFKAEATREGLPVGKAITLAMGFWLQEHAKPIRNMLDFRSVNLGKGSEKLSEEIDKTLYGMR